MDLADVMDALAAQLATIDGLRVYAWPEDSVATPAAVVSWPEQITFDGTYRRGSDEMTAQVVLLVPRTPVRVARAELAAYAAGSGSRSVKQVLESAVGTYTALDSLRVTSVDFDVISIGGVDHMGAVFDVHIVGRGE